jgi:ankyrin repeat protein
VSRLTAHRAVVDARNDAGNTALMAAAAAGNESIVRTLLMAKADPYIRNLQRMQALDLAERGGHDHLAHVLRQRTSVFAWLRRQIE